MEVQVIRVQSGNLAILENVDPECFDEPIDMNRAACCVASPDASQMIRRALRDFR